jgi:hypothetical protein
MMMMAARYDAGEPATSKHAGYLWNVNRRHERLRNCGAGRAHFAPSWLNVKWLAGAPSDGEPSC